MYLIDRATPDAESRSATVLRAPPGAAELPNATALARRPGEAVVLIEGTAGAIAAQVPPLLVVARHGTLAVTVDGCRATLEPGGWLATEAAARLEIVGGPDASWLAIAWPRRVAERIAQRTLGRAPAEPLVFADAGRPGPGDALTDAIERLERALVLPNREYVAGEAAALVLAAVLERQHAAHEDALARTCGRTERHRRHLYARLNRVRRVVEAAPPRDYTMRELADVAHLSVWHFVRSFGRVFGETPHRYLTRARLDGAARMLARGDEPIARIAERHGFENRCAFARLFRAHFGMAATQYRRAARQPAQWALAHAGVRPATGTVAA